MIITSIEKSKNKKDMMMVFVDNEYSFSIAEEDYFRLNLYETKDITGEEINYIKGTVNLSRAKAFAVRYLSLRVRSESEVRHKLKSEGFSNNTIDTAVEELKAIGYINDKMYAQKYIFDRSKLKPKAKKMIRLELESKGVDKEIVDQALEDWSVDESILAESLVKRKFGKYDLTQDQILRKIYLFLKHRGFEHSVINELINKIKAE